MGLPINKLIVATNNNDILKRVITSGIYEPIEVKHTISPSMDIQVASNFERLLFDVLNQDDNKVSSLMSNLASKGSFKLSSEEVNIIKKDFCAEKTSDKQTLEIIKNFSDKYNFILDPHTATAVGAAKKNNDGSETLILSTAHPYKFLETIKMATSKKITIPSQLSNTLDKKEKYDILENNLLDVKSYILEKSNES